MAMVRKQLYLPANLDRELMAEAKRRGISQAEARVKEAGKLGFERCVLPSSNVTQLKHIQHPDLAGVASLSDCWKLLF